MICLLLLFRLYTVPLLQPMMNRDLSVRVPSLMPATSRPSPLLFAVLCFAMAAALTADAQQGRPAPGGPAVAIRKVEGRIGAAAVHMLDGHLKRGGMVRTVPSPNGVHRVEMELAPGNKLIGRLLSPAGKELFERDYDRSDLDHDIRQLADDIVLTLTKRPGIATSQIAFVSTRNGRREIFVCDYDGRNVRQITRDGRENVSPAISPRGRKLVLTTHAPGFADLMVLPLAGGKPQPLARQPGAKTGAAFSHDGKQIAYTLTSGNNADLYVVDSDGGKPKRLIASPAIETTPAWSPDGKQIVYSSNGGGSPQLYVISAKGGKPRRLHTGHPDCRKPGWSPDAASIVFVSGGAQPAVTVFDLRSKRSRVLSAGDDPAWGADSRHITFVYQGNLYVTDTYTGQSRAIVSGMGAISEPSWTW